MPRDKTESHKRVIEAAKKEFLEFGYQDASMRRIAAVAGLTASGLYKHFSGKEEMFENLVKPTVTAFKEMYERTKEREFREIDEQMTGRFWEGKNETVEAMAFIYDHLDEFKLIVTKSQGTKYEMFVHELAVMEETTTLKYMETLREKDMPVKQINRQEFHLIVTNNINAILLAITHDLGREEALEYAKTLDDFYVAGWRHIFGLE